MAVTKATTPMSLPEMPSADTMASRATGTSSAIHHNARRICVSFAAPSCLEIRRRLRIRQIPRQGFEHGHAHGDTHFDLLADQRLRAVGDGGVDLDAAIHRTGMHDERVGLGESELAAVQSI